jgi:general secretion pathway protein D
VLQSPQLRSVDNQKATLKIGDRQPTATGSFQPGIGGVGINPLVNTQFTFIDVGVNVDITPKVHDNGEISMHVELEISSVRDHVNLGGIDQPVISQEKAINDIRLRDGQVNLLAGLNQTQDSKTVTGIPGLSSIPIIGKLFSSHQIDKSSSEMLIALIPHIVRRPDINQQNLRGISVGNATVVKLNYGPREAAKPGAPEAKPSALGTPAAPQAAPGQAAPAAPATPAPAQAAPATPAPQAAAPEPAAPPTPAAPAGVPRAAMIPSQVQTAMGGTVTVNLVLENAKDVASAPAQITYDPKVLRMNDIVQGDLLSRGQPASFTKNIMNDSGTATVTLNRAPGAAGVTGSGTVVTMTFQTVGRGVATVTAPQFTPRDAKGQPILTASPLAMVTVK